MTLLDFKLLGSLHAYTHEIRLSAPTVATSCNFCESSLTDVANGTVSAQRPQANFGAASAQRLKPGHVQGERSKLVKRDLSPGCPDLFTDTWPDWLLAMGWGTIPVHTPCEIRGQLAPTGGQHHLPTPRD